MPLAARGLADLAQAERDAGRLPETLLSEVDDLVRRFPHTSSISMAKYVSSPFRTQLRPCQRNTFRAHCIVIVPAPCTYRP